MLYNFVENLFIFGRFFGGYHCSDRECSQSIFNRKCTLCRVFSSGKWESISPSLSLCIDIYAAYLVYQWVHQIRNLVWVSAKNTYLLSM